METFMRYIVGAVIIVLMFAMVYSVIILVNLIGGEL